MKLNKGKIMNEQQQRQIKKYQLAEIDTAASTVWSDDVWIPNSVIAKQTDLQKFVNDIDSQYRASVQALIQDDCNLSKVFPSTDLIQVMDYDEYYTSDDGHVGLYKHDDNWYLYMGDALDGLALEVATEIGIVLSREQIHRGLEESLKVMVLTIRNISNFLG